MKKVIACVLLLSAALWAQQPQSATAPLFAVNAKYANGVAPGYAPTAGSGLTLNLGKGTANCLGTLVEYAGGTLSMTNSTTNYVYLNPSSSCAATSNTSGFTSTTIWIAKVTTSGGAITAIDDVRTGFLAPGTGSGTVTGTGTANDCAYWVSTSALGDFSDFICNASTHTFSSGAAGITDLSAATGTAAFKVPSHTTNTASAAAVLDYDTTNSNYHANSGADSLILIVPTASIPATGDLIDASVVSSKLVGHDSGIATANVVSAASNFTSGNLVKAAASNKTTSDSGIATADVLHAVSPALGYAHFPGSSQVPTSVTLPRGITFDIACSSGLVTTSLDPCATSAYITVPFGCTISAYNLTVDAGTITVKFWKVATGTAIPTSSNSISTSGVSISSGTAIHSTTTSDFTSTTVAANDIMAMAVTAVSTAKEVTGVLQCDESQ